MGIIKINVSEDVEASFRMAAARKFGYKKGAITYALLKAINDWVAMQGEIKKIESPVEAISGLMKNVSKNSLELQHELGGILIGKHTYRR